MAKISSAILNDALENCARLLGDVSPTVANYKGMGAGEDATEADATDTNLIGTDIHYNAVTPTYEASYKTVWQSTFLYADLPTGHTIRELVICKDSGGAINTSLLRMTIDAITLNEGEQVTLIIKNAVQQGT